MEAPVELVYYPMNFNLLAESVFKTAEDTGADMAEMFGVIPAMIIIVGFIVAILCSGSN
tara:strand:- start:607 stop:783 length:177 start_codon:yes stop_codon:yes gene_type:complete